MVTAVVSSLDSGASGLGSSPTVVVLGILYCHSASLHPGMNGFQETARMGGGGGGDSRL